MENNKHNIKNIEDVLRVVNSKNKENFLKDFSAWLDINITLKENLEEKGLSEAVNFKPNLVWIDDGKNDINVTLNIQEKNQK